MLSSYCRINNYLIADTRKNPNFGTSLLLANSPMSPKIVNGSFAAIFDNNDVLYDFAKKLAHKLDVKDSPGKGIIILMIPIRKNVRLGNLIS